MDNKQKCITDEYNRIQEKIDRYTETKNLWMNVKRVKKQNGTDYAVLKKNFQNASVYKNGNYNVIHVSDGNGLNDFIEVYYEHNVDYIFNVIDKRIQMYDEYLKPLQESKLYIQDTYTYVMDKMKDILDYAESNGIYMDDIIRFISDNKSIIYKG